tara:strand:- start:1660 stop:1893 length:234 start_codon:yes stop_codon:yes gene_type:complete
MNTKKLSRQDHIRLLQQAVINGDGGMELLIAMRERFEKRKELLEKLIDEGRCEFSNINKLELELLNIQLRLFDGKER